MTLSRRALLGGLLGGVGCALFPLTSPACETVKLLEIGWHTPDTDALLAHIDAYEAQAPWFDGLVVDLVQNAVLTSGAPRDTSAHLAWTCFGYARHTSLDTGGAGTNYGKSYQQLLKVPFGRYTHNLLKLTTQHGAADLFDPIVYPTYTIPNMRLHAHTALATGCKGIFFDTENYSRAVWSYPWHVAKFHNGRTFAQYQARVYELGQQVMIAFQQGFPALDVVLSWGYWLAYASGVPLAQHAYGLLPSFIDGMLAVANVTIHDGFEHSYAFKIPAEFGAAARSFTTASWAHPQYRPGFGLWLDYNRHWDTVNTSTNWFSPTQWATSIALAESYAQAYVWLYTEKPNWFDGTLPAAYSTAMASIP